MEIVVDTNIIISSLLRNGITRKIIILSPLKMYTADYATTEIEAHKSELIKKSKLDEESLDYLLELIFSKIDLVPLNNISPFRYKAQEIMGKIDIDDTLFLALAMSLNCPIWSNDAHFKMQSVIKAYTTKELLDHLKAQ